MQKPIQKTNILFVDKNTTSVCKIVPLYEADKLFPGMTIGITYKKVQNDYNDLGIDRNQLYINLYESKYNGQFYINGCRMRVGGNLTIKKSLSGGHYGILRLVDKNSIENMRAMFDKVTNIYNKYNAPKGQIKLYLERNKINIVIKESIKCPFLENDENCENTNEEILFNIDDDDDQGFIKTKTEDVKFFIGIPRDIMAKISIHLNVKSDLITDINFDVLCDVVFKSIRITTDESTYLLALGSCVFFMDKDEKPKYVYANVDKNVDENIPIF